MKIKPLELIAFAISIILITSPTFLLLSCQNPKENKKEISKQEIILEKILNDEPAQIKYWDGEKFSGFENRQAVLAKDYLISTSDKLASKAGAEILVRGGNAIDAAIAAQMVLNVVEPQSSGIGGGLFLLYFDSKSKKSIYFNGREKAPQKVHEKIFLDKNGKAMKFHDAVGGGLSVGTPGALKALEEAHKKYGKLPWGELFTSAIKIANEGFILDEKIHTVLNQLPYLNKFDGMKIYFENDKPKAVGSLIKNAELAKTFDLIAKQGSKPFYHGKIANDIVKAVQNSEINPGYLEISDLKNYKIKKGKLICGNYRKIYKICSMPLPSSGGITLLQILNILENFQLDKIKPSSAQAINLISQATRLAYADRAEYLGDISGVPVRKMLSKKYAKERAKLINLQAAAKNISAGNFENVKKKKIAKNKEKPSTTHISIIDKEGNAVALTSTIEYLFGSVLMVDGFMLNNQLTDFAFIPEINAQKVANRVEPLKQPLSSMTPTFIFDEKDNLIAAIGSPGGPRIIQFVLKTIIATLDWNMDIQQAVSLPNFIALNGVIELEDRTSLTALKPDLEKMGHKVVIKDITSGLNGFMISGNKIIGASDSRRSGAAIGK
jgi:gamma-glutamyltranspeptidase/glutathione hydrolase